MTPARQKRSQHTCERREMHDTQQTRRAATANTTCVPRKAGDTERVHNSSYKASDVASARRGGCNSASRRLRHDLWPKAHEMPGVSHAQFLVIQRGEELLGGFNGRRVRARSGTPGAWRKHGGQPCDTSFKLVQVGSAAVCGARCGPSRAPATGHAATQQHVQAGCCVPMHALDLDLGSFAHA